MVDSLADAWCRGMVAGADGWPARDNPYPPNSPLAESWKAGRLMGQELCPLPRPAQPQHRSRDGQVVTFPAQAVRNRRAKWS